jgi:hypothetical protein
VAKAVKEDLAENLPLRTLFHETWSRWVEFAVKNREAYSFLIAHHHVPYLDQASVAINEKIHEGYRFFFEIGRQEQIIKDINPELIMVIVTGIFSEMMRAWIHCPIPSNDILCPSPASRRHDLNPAY